MSTNRFGLHTEAIFNARCMHSSTRSQSLYLSTATETDSLSLLSPAATALAGSRGGQNRCEHRLTMRHWSGFFSSWRRHREGDLGMEAATHLVGVLRHLGDERLVVLLGEVSAAQQRAHRLGQHLHLIRSQRQTLNPLKGMK